MWEQIQSNKRKSWMLVISMALVLLALGYVIGESAGQGVGILGIMAAFAIWVIMSLVAYFKGDNILLAVSGAKKVEKDDHPVLFNVVEEMTIASGLGKMPDIYIIDDLSMNAFAVGRKPETSAVAVTVGLLGHLNRDELQGVIAHEISHVTNRDVLLMTMVSVMLGTIVMISEVFFRSLIYGSGRRRHSSSKKSGGGGIVIVIAIVFGILAPLLARLIYFAISREREYLADANAVVLTRYPNGLASALEQLGRGKQPVARANKATAAMYIVNPFAKAKLSALTSTHPPVQERVKILRSIGGSATYGAYQQAWERVGSTKAGHLPASAVADTTHGGAVREADPSVAKSSPRARMRDAGDALRHVNKFAFLPCVCGLKLKIPPDFKHDQIKCPKCKRQLQVPVAELAAVYAATEQLPEAVRRGKDARDKTKGRGSKSGKQEGRAARPPESSGAPLRIQHKEGEWMTFKCSCGKSKTLSPAFSASRMQCKKCGRTIEIA